MAGNFYGGNQNCGMGPRGGTNGQNHRGAPRQYQPQTMDAKPMPAEFVDRAEEVIRSGNWSNGITTSKIRRLFSLFTEIYNVETLRTGPELAPESVYAMRLARIRMLYEAGRDNKVKAFLGAAELIPYLKDIGTSREKLMNYFHYMEALVAYHKFYGGKEG